MARQITMTAAASTGHQRCETRCHAGEHNHANPVRSSSYFKLM